MTEYIDQLRQALIESSTPKKTLRTLLVSPTVSPTLSALSQITPSEPQPTFAGTIESEPGVSVPIEQGISPLGFSKNILSGLGLVAGGIGTLLKYGAHDVAKGVAEVLPGEQQIEQDPIAAKALVGGAFGYDAWMPTGTNNLGIPTELGLPEGEDAPSAIMEDLKTRYGPLIRLDIPEFFTQLYEKPVSYGLDALMVAGAPGAAGKGAQLLSKIGPVSRALPVGRVAEKLLPFRGPGMILRPIGSGMKDVGTARLLTESGVYVPTTEELLKYGTVPVKMSVNPLVRKAQMGLHRIFTTDTIPGTNIRVGPAVEQALAGITDPKQAQLLKDRLVTALGQGEALDYGNQLVLAALLDQAQPLLGRTSRLYRPSVRHNLQKSVMRMRQALHGSALIDLRELTLKAMNDEMMKLKSADDYAAMVDVIENPSHIPLDPRLWGYQQFGWEGTYQLSWDGRAPSYIEAARVGEDIGPGILTPPSYTSRAGKEIPTTAIDYPDILAGLENVQPGTKVPMWRETPTGGLFPNPLAVDLKGGAGIRRGTRIEWPDDNLRARYLRTTEEGTWVDYGNGPELAHDENWQVVEHIDTSALAAQAAALGIKLPETPKTTKPPRTQPQSKPKIDVQERSRLTEAEEQAAQTDFAAKMAAAADEAEQASGTKVAPKGLDLSHPKVSTAVWAANAKANILRAKGMDIDTSTMRRMIDAELEKHGIDRRGNPISAPMELTKAKPTPEVKQVAKKVPPKKAKPAKSTIPPPEVLPETIPEIPMEVRERFRTEEPYAVTDEAGYVTGTFATRDEAMAFLNAEGGLPSFPEDMLTPDLPPLIPAPNGGAMPPPVTPYTTTFPEAKGPGEIPRPSNLNDTPIVEFFQQLLDNAHGNGQPRNAETFSTPFYGPSSTYRPARIGLVIDDMRNVDAHLNEVLRATDSDLVTTWNSLNTGGDMNPKYGAYRSFNAWVRTKDGRIIELQFYTPDMEIAQKAVGKTWTTIHQLRDKSDAEYAIAEQIRQEAAASKNGLPTKAQQIEIRRHLEEKERIDTEILAQQRLAAGFNEGIVRHLANPDGYEPIYKAADKVKAIWYLEQMEPEFRHLDPMLFGAAEMLDRAFLPRKVELYWKYRKSLYDSMRDYQNILIQSGLSPEDAIPGLTKIVAENIRELLRRSNHIDLSDIDNTEFAGGIEAWVERTFTDVSKPKDGNYARAFSDKLDEVMHPAIEDGRKLNKEVALWQDVFNYRWTDLDNEFPTSVLPGYYPHINPSKSSPGGYLGRMHNLKALNYGEPDALRRSKGLLAETGNYIHPKFLDSVEDYRKIPAFKNASDDIIEAQRIQDAHKMVSDVYSLRATQLTRHRQVLDFIDEIKGLSRPVPPGELPLWETGKMPGYSLINFDGLKKQVKLRERLTDKIFEDGIASSKLANTDDWDTIIIDNLEKVLDEAMNETMDTMLKNARTGDQFWAVPDRLVSDFNRNISRAMSWKVRFYYDAPMNVWKSMVLAFSPRWLVNNTFGNIIFSLIKDPAAITELVRRKDAQYRKTLEYVFEGQLPEGVERGLFASATQRVTNYGFGEVVAPKTANVYKTLRGQPSELALRVPEKYQPLMSIYSRLARGTGRTSTRMRDINTAIEDAFRASVFTSSVRRQITGQSLGGFSRDMQMLEKLQTLGPESIRPSVIQNGIADLNSTLGDYANLTSLERNVVRRFILPFYPFYRHSVKFLLRLPIDHPYKAATLLMLGRLDAEMTKDFPEYLLGTVGIGTWSDQMIGLRTKNLNPLNMLGAGQSLTQGLSPLMQSAVAMGWGVNTLTGEPLTDRDVMEDFAGNKVRVIRGPDGEITGITQLPKGYKVSPGAFKLMQNMFPQVNVLTGLAAAVGGEDIGARYSGSGEVIIDPETGKPKYPQPWWKDPLGYVGLPTVAYDPQELFLDQQQQKEAVLDSWRNRYAQ
jgi:hypothetical protein